ncbi:ABC transporter substrate-binding protein [Brevibacterium oceani]|uniref:ABC transporter substrate-binding protein n=1 Tax=Brevibacterium oceani TaxID=358099 RepID=UPI0015E7DD72|nr:ABC transporter substrate-binding protein [Brevibacterium oceani]
MRTFAILRHPQPRRAAAAITAAVLVVSLAGCGTPSDTQESEATQSAGTTEYPLKLDTPFGSTTLEEAPERVVAIGDLDDALALGVVPVGSFKPAGDAEELYDYEQDALEEAKSTSPVKRIDPLFDPYAELDYEAIAELDPDVILAASYWDLEKSYGTLSEIAPVVALPKGTDSNWENRHELVAQALDREQKGKDNVQAVEDAFAEAREENPEFADLTLNYAVVYPTQVTYMSVPDTEASWFFTQLGFQPGPEHGKFGKEYPKDVVSEEQTSLLDADIVVIGYHSLLEDGQREKFEDSSLFKSLPAVKNGTYIPLPKGHDSSIPQPGVLSSLDDLEAVLPLLEETAPKAS